MSAVRSLRFGISLAALISALPAGLHAAEAVAPVAVQPPAIRVVEADRRELVERLPVTGTIAPREEAAVGVDLQGLVVLELAADVGDRVEKGQLLARLDAQSLKLTLAQAEAQKAQVEAQGAQAASQIVNAEIGVRKAGETMERVSALRKRGVASQSQFDDATNAVDSAAAQLTTARKALAAAEAQVAVVEAQMAEIDRQISRAEVRAPAAGVVLARNAMVGAVVGASAGPVFRIAIGGELELQANVSEIHLPRLAEGMSVSVTPAGSDKPLAGRIRLVGPEVSRTTRLGVVYISLPDDPAMRAGNFARAEIEMSRENAIAIPGVAVLFRGAETYVQRVEQGAIHSVPVRLGARAEGLVAVRDGLAEGDQIVSRAGAFVADGDRVTPVLDEVTGALNP